MNDEGVMCDFCEVAHPSDYDCDGSKLLNMILDIDRKVNDQWEMNYKSIENISKRVSKVEDDIISLYRKIEAFNGYMEIASKDIGKLFRTKADAELAGELHSQTEERLENLEKMQSSMLSMPNVVWQKYNKIPYKCPVCDGKYIAMFKECESACLACEKGIVWG
jgi:hypothetical protein